MADAKMSSEDHKIISRFLAGDLSLVHDLVERHESMNTGTRVLATVTTAGVEIYRDVFELLHQDNAIEQENAHIKVSIAQVLIDMETGEEKLVPLIAKSNDHKTGKVVSEPQSLRRAGTDAGAHAYRKRKLDLTQEQAIQSHVLFGTK